MGAAADYLRDFKRDLTADDGLRDYCKDLTDTISLLSAEEYRRFHGLGLILKKERNWWLLTANSPKNQYVLSVNTGGSLYNYYAYGGNSGVVPALLLLSDCPVSVA